jgi:hypothetical protein
MRRAARAQAGAFEGDVGVEERREHGSMVRPSGHARK